MFHAPTLGMLLLFVSTGGLLMAVSAPLIQRKVKPNPVYGVRTPKTLSNEGVWYPANEYGGRLLFRAGVIELAAAILFLLVPGIGGNFTNYCLANGAVTLVSVLGASAMILRYVSTL